jgi:hypothetical protein
MMCFWGHKWSKWKIVLLEIYYPVLDRKTKAERKQRERERCGKIERDEI